MSDQPLQVAAMLDDNRMHFMPLAEHDGQLWIVPTWIPEPDEGYSPPPSLTAVDNSWADNLANLVKFKRIRRCPRACTEWGHESYGRAG